MTEDPYMEYLFTYLTNIHSKKKIRRVEDLEKFSSKDLLQLAEVIDDRILPLFMSLLKTSRNGAVLFKKLMGEHEEDNRELVDQFFERYQKMILADEKILSNANPLMVYLPKSLLGDVAFVESRRQFFLRQTIETINEYLRKAFKTKKVFKPGEQEAAWNYFWERVLNTD